MRKLELFRDPGSGSNCNFFLSVEIKLQRPNLYLQTPGKIDTGAASSVLYYPDDDLAIREIENPLGGRTLRCTDGRGLFGKWVSLRIKLEGGEEEYALPVYLVKQEKTRLVLGSHGFLSRGDLMIFSGEKEPALFYFREIES